MNNRRPESGTSNNLFSLETDYERNSGSEIRYLLEILRYEYLKSAISISEKKMFDKANIYKFTPPAILHSKTDHIKKIIDRRRINWGDWRFHLNYRIHLNRYSIKADLDNLFSLVKIKKKHGKALWNIIHDGVDIGNNNGYTERHYYDLSILPLNLLLDKSVLNYFIPPTDYFLSHPTNKADPYGIVRGYSRAEVAKGKPSVIINEETRLILGAHKFGYSFLLDLDFNCPIGCSDCYKTRLGTREYLKDKEKPRIYYHPELGELNPPSKNQMVEQLKCVVRWMNNDPRGKKVYDIILSGGEPFALPNRAIKVVLNELKNVKNLRILRICTGTLFLGLPFRIDDELLDTLRNYSDATGVKITIQAHLGNHHMISPEAVIAVQKIRQRGIPIYSQVPIKNGINFFLNNLNKTMDYMIELGRRQVQVGVEPYVFIVDMHPSTNAYYVPIEPLMQVWSKLVESHEYPGLERPKALSVLFENGNIILSGHTLFSAKKKVDKSNDRVIYRIPRVGTTSGWKMKIAETFDYEEPLIRGINDDPHSLIKLIELWEKYPKGHF
ncbi:MAG: hypothetical protein Q8N56_00665 [bacterium]|nr:hypothetical protein [bacterium]